MSLVVKGIRVTASADAAELTEADLEEAKQYTRDSAIHHIEAGGYMDRVDLGATETTVTIANGRVSIETWVPFRPEATGPLWETVEDPQ